MTGYLTNFLGGLAQLFHDAHLFGVGKLGETATPLLLVFKDLPGERAHARYLASNLAHASTSPWRFKISSSRPLSSCPDSTKARRRAKSFPRPVCTAMAARCSPVITRAGTPSKSTVTACSTASRRSADSAGRNWTGHPQIVMASPPGLKELVDRGQRQDQGRGLEEDEDIQVVGGDRFKVKSGSHRAADGTLADDARFLQGVDFAEGLLHGVLRTIFNHR